MVTKSTKVLSLVLAAALALVLLAGMPTTTSEGATAHSINVPGDWPTSPAAINMDDGDTLTILAAAGSPSATRDTVINIANGANVTINGPANVVQNLRIYEVPGTAPHTITLNNLKITASSLGGEGFIHQNATIVLVGNNVINGNGGVALDSAAGLPLTITSTSGGSLTLNGVSQAGIWATALNITGSATVEANSTGSGAAAIYLGNNAPNISVTTNATLTATNDNGLGIEYLNSDVTQNINSNGVMQARGDTYGIYSDGNLNITGTGQVAAYAKGIGLQANNLTISQTNVIITGENNEGISIATATTNVSLTNGATLGAVGKPAASIAGGKGFMLAPGTTVSLRNNSSGLETHPFTMSTVASNKWVLTNDVAFAVGSTATSSPADINVEAGKAGTIMLGSPPTIVAPSSMSLTEGYAATASGVFTFTGYPSPPTVTKVSGDDKITWDNTNRKVVVAAGLAPDTYQIVLKAANGVTPDATVTFTVLVNPAGGGATVTSVTVSPSTADVEKGGTKTFTAAVAGTGNPGQGVTWTVTGGTTGTSIDSAGKLTVAAGETASSLIVKATSTVDTTKSGTATVTVKTEGGGGDGGGSNAILYAVIVIVILVVVLALLYFFVIKKKP